MSRLRRGTAALWFLRFPMRFLRFLRFVGQCVECWFLSVLRALLCKSNHKNRCCATSKLGKNHRNAVLFEHFFEVGVPIGRSLQKSVKKKTDSLGKPRKTSPFLRSFWEHFLCIFQKLFLILSWRNFFSTLGSNGVPKR